MAILRRLNNLIADFKFKNVFVLLVLILIVFSLKFNVLNESHYWDAITTIYKSLWYESHSLFTIVRLPYGRPPLLYWLLGSLMRLFYSTRVLPHFIILVFSVTGVYFTYLLGNHLFNERFGFLAAVSLFLSPLYFAQSGIVHMAIPLTALTVATLYFWLEKRYYSFALSSVILVLVKEPGIFLILSIVLYKLLKHRKNIIKDILDNKNKYISLSLPFITLLGWLTYYGLNSTSNGGKIGRFFNHFSINNFHVVLERFFFYLKTLLFTHYKFLIIGISMISLFYLLYKNKSFLNQIRGGSWYIIFLTSTIYITFFSFYNFLLPRYILPIFPFFYLVTLGVIDTALNKKYLLWILVGVMICLSFLSWTGNRNVHGSFLESNLEYRDSIETHKMAAEFVERNHKKKIILTTWPLNQELRNPAYGYVKNPLKVKSKYWGNYSLNEVQIVITSDQSKHSDFFQESIKSLRLNPIKSFTVNNKSTKIYRVLGVDERAYHNLTSYSKEKAKE